MKASAILFMFLLALTTACFSPPEFSNAPEIGFVGISGDRTTDPLGNRQDSITVTISFKDGDGDLGLSNQDTLSPFQPFEQQPDGSLTVNLYHHNYHMTVKRMKDGMLEEVNFLDGGKVKGRFPRLVDGNGPLEGELNFGRYFLIGGSSNTFNEGDSLLFEVFIIDRALQQSNTITTDMIVLGDYE